jgi:hypothetical protein
MSPSVVQESPLPAFLEFSLQPLAFALVFRQDDRAEVGGADIDARHADLSIFQRFSFLPRRNRMQAGHNFSFCLSAGTHSIGI